MIWACPSEGRDSALPTRAQAPVLSNRKPTQAIWPTSFVGGRYHKQQEQWSYNLQKGNFKDSSLDTMRIIINMVTLVKMKDQINEEEIVNLSEK